MLDWVNEDFLDSVWFIPVRIALILVGACVIRAIAVRLIDRAVRAMVVQNVHARKQTAKPKGLKAVAKTVTFVDARREQRIGALGSLGRSAVTVVMMIVVSITILGQLGFNVAALLAGTSIIGIAVAFGVQTILRDLISGIFMLFEDQLGMGDYVKVADIDGVVEEVGLRLTKIRDADGTVWYIRNGDIATVGNYSQGSGSGRPPAVSTETSSEHEPANS
jgi:small-conductance mechanosensitive channel